MYKRRNYFYKVTLAFIVALVAGCGGGSSSDDDDDILGQNTPFLFVERSITTDAAANLEHFRRALETAESSPQDLNSPYAFNPGALLYHRSSLSPDAEQNEVLSSYMGTRHYDVKDLSVSPDGSKVLFAARGPEDHPSDYTWNIYEYDFQSRRVRRIIADDDIANRGEDTNPTYTTDGRIVFSSTRAAGNPGYPGAVDPGDMDDDCYKIGPSEEPSLLHIMTAQGENILQITFGNNHDTETTTLADGKIAFLRWSRSYNLLSYCDLNGPVNGNLSREDVFSRHYPIGLERPEPWTRARLCSFSITTPLGQALPSNHYTVLAIHPDTGVIEQLYETVTIYGSDEEFVYLDDLVQAQDGHLIGLLKHFYNEHRGGNIVRLEDPAAPARGSIFANAAPRPLVTNDINLYPTQLSPKGWYSAVVPYRDGSSRLLVSWSQCTTQRNGVHAFCAQNSQGQVSSEYGIWVYDPQDDSRLPVVKARRDKVYTELALAQNQPALGLPFRPFNPVFEDNLDESRLICDDPSPIDPTDPDPGDPDNPGNPSDPDNPDDPDNPPGEPGDEEDPDNPGNPGDPNNPDDPDDPDNPDNPDDPPGEPGDEEDPDNPGNRKPVAVAGHDLNVKAGQRVTLDGSGSYDPDRDQLSYSWVFVPAATSPETALDNTDLEGSTTPTPSFIPDDEVQIPVQVDFVFIIDGSASMREEINQVRNGLAAFVENINDPERLVDARFAVVTFEERPRGNYAPRVKRDFVGGSADVVDQVVQAFIEIETSVIERDPVRGGYEQREAGLEAIRWVLGDPSLDHYPPSGLEFRPTARKNLILVTDEDSDGPPELADYEPPVPFDDERWQEEINRTARKVVDARAYLDLLIEPDDGASKLQYGDPDADRVNPENGRFDSEATRAALEQSEYRNSLQALVLKESLVARSYRVTDAADAVFVDSFFNSKVEESFESSLLGRYTLALTVNDGQETSDPSEVIVRAFSGNVPPNARAGRDQNALVDGIVRLDGSGSFDDDGPMNLSYHWRFFSLPEGSSATISNADQAEASFVPDVAGDYVLELEVSDGAADGTDRGVDYVTIHVSADNVPPNANAGSYPPPVSCNPVALDAGASSDPDNDSLEYRWSLVYAPDGSELESRDIPNGITSSFTPDRSGSYVLRLDVSDGLHSSWDNALIVVEGCP